MVRANSGRKFSHIVAEDVIVRDFSEPPKDYISEYASETAKSLVKTIVNCLYKSAKITREEAASNLNVTVPAFEEMLKVKERRNKKKRIIVNR